MYMIGDLLHMSLASYVTGMMISDHLHWSLSHVTMSVSRMSGPPRYSAASSHDRLGWCPR